MREAKITADHLKRDAYLYIRQSSPRQVTEHNESTQRQYALRSRAIAAGWPIERIRVIDCDLGKSASIAPAARDGFQQLVSDVALGKAGIVMGLEASRLARKSSEWHRLIELCGMTATLLADEDGFYDPADFNDRLVLGLKGTMSEAESHIIKARMRGGQLNKARRGELEMGPPVGLVYRNDGTIGLDPDVEVQKALQLVFDTFERTGSAMETVRYFLQQGLLFPRRLRTGPNKGDLLWAPPRHARIVQVLHNPRYAGAYVYGRTRTRHMPDGSTKAVKVARAEWQFVMPDMHPGYIDWERFESNQHRLAENARAFAGERRARPPRRAYGRAVSSGAWPHGSTLHLPGDLSPQRWKSLSDGSGQGRRSSDREPDDRDDDANDAGSHAGCPARTRSACRRNRCIATQACRTPALRRRIGAPTLYEGRSRKPACR